MRALLNLLNLTFCKTSEAELVALTGVAAKCIMLSDSCTAGKMPCPLQGRVNVLHSKEYVYISDMHGTADTIYIYGCTEMIPDK